MLNILKKIRKMTLDENKFGRYLVYAVGEIVLVMIGILLALQVNNWNIDKLNRESEAKYLKSIVEEIERNRKANARIIAQRLPRKMEALLLAKDYLEGNYTIRDTLDFINKIGYGGVFSGGLEFGLADVYGELLSTGNLSLIRNQEAKRLIARYYSRLKTNSLRAQVHASTYSKFTSSLRPFDSRNPEYVSAYDQKVFIQGIDSEEFRRLVNIELSYAYKVREYIASLERVAQEAIDLIKSL